MTILYTLSYNNYSTTYGGCYDIAKRNLTDLNSLLDSYESFCNSYSIPFHTNFNILSPDPSTLFCTSGMQRYKPFFPDIEYHNTFSNVQQCLRLNDLEEVGDSTHYLNFHMLGFFSFREWSLQDTVNFWLVFMEHIGTYPDYVTIHPDKKEWSSLYPSDMEIRYDNECIWSDGSIGGYCTEFYKNDIEIGNIVNTLGTCIDVGFGCERLLSFHHKQSIHSRLDILSQTIKVLIDSGIKPTPNKHGYILRKLLVECVLSNHILPYSEYRDIHNKQVKNYQEYLRLIKKKEYSQKDSSWWKDTIGIDIKHLEKYNNLKLIYLWSM